MENVHDLIKKKKKFIGRKKELLLMKEQLRSNQDNWSIMHLYSSAGMGKTALLQQFESMHTDLPVIYIDGHHGFSHPDDLLVALQHELVAKKILPSSIPPSHLIQELNKMASKQPLFIMLFDGLDQWSEHTLHWFRKEWVKALPIRFRIFTAGRNTLDNWNLEFGWESVVKNVQIYPFSTSELRQYTGSYGISDPHLLYQISIITEGVPLAVSMTCNWILQNKRTKALDESDSRFLLESFDKNLLSEDKLNGVNKMLLALASLTYTFDQELLEHILGEPISLSEFTQLCQSPFVSVHSHGGWSVKLGFRRWARAGLQERFPDTFEEFKQRAREVIERRIASSAQEQEVDLPLSQAIGKLFLNEDEIVHSFIYFGDSHFNLRTAQEHELPLLADIYQQSLKGSPPYLVDDTHQENFFHPIWKAKPTAISIIERNNHCSGFYIQIPLNKTFRTILKNNPVTQRLVEVTTAEEEYLFFWIIATDPPLNAETIGFVMRQIFFPSVLGKRRVICMLPSKEQVESSRLIGFKPLDSAEFTTSSGLTFYFCVLDSRNQELTSTEKIEHSAWIDLTKKLLANFPELHLQRPLLEQLKQYWDSELALEEIETRFCQIIELHFQRLKEGNKQKQTQAQILLYAYLKKIGSHELVAERLNLPISTYYRHLKKLVHHLAVVLQTERL